MPQNDDGDHGPYVRVSRKVLSQQQYEDDYAEKVDDKAGACDRVKKIAAKILPTSVSAFFLRLFPFIGILTKHYNWKKDFIADLITGATVAFLHVPQAMAYGQLASLRPIHGLYVAFLPGIIYFFLGTSRQMSIGVFAVASLMVAKALDTELASGYYNLPSAPNETIAEALPNVTNDSLTIDYETAALKVRVDVATSLNLVIGIMQVALGILGAGFVTDYLNEPFVSGYTTACACHVFTSQLWLAVGIKGTRHAGAFKILLVSKRTFTFFKN